MAQCGLLNCSSRPGATQMEGDRGLIRSMLKVISKLRAGMDIRLNYDVRVSVMQGSNPPPEEPWPRVVAALELDQAQVSCLSCTELAVHWFNLDICLTCYG